MPATFNYLTPALPCGTATTRSARLRVAARQRRSIAQRAAESAASNYRRNVTPTLAALVVLGAICIACLVANHDLPLVRNGIVYARAAEHVIEQGFER